MSRLLRKTFDISRRGMTISPWRPQSTPRFTARRDAEKPTCLFYMYYIRYASSTWVAEWMLIIITVRGSRMLRFGRLRSRSVPFGYCRDRPPSRHVLYPSQNIVCCFMFEISNAVWMFQNVSWCCFRLFSLRLILRPTNSFEFKYFSDTELVITQ